MEVLGVFLVLAIPVAFVWALVKAIRQGPRISELERRSEEQSELIRRLTARRSPLPAAGILRSLRRLSDPVGSFAACEGPPFELDPQLRHPPPAGSQRGLKPGPDDRVGAEVFRHERPGINPGLDLVGQPPEELAGPPDQQLRPPGVRLFKIFRERRRDRIGLIALERLRLCRVRRLLGQPV